MIGSAFGGPMDDVGYTERATASGRWSSQFWSGQGWDEKREENLTQVPIPVPSPSRSLCRQQSQILHFRPRGS